MSEMVRVDGRPITYGQLFVENSELREMAARLEADNSYLKALVAELLTALKTHLPGHLKGIENCPTCAALIKKAEAQK